jgi:hypothetical protein
LKYLSAKWEYLSANYLSAKNLSAKRDIYQPIEKFISQVGIFINQIPGVANEMSYFGVSVSDVLGTQEVS